MLAACTAGLAQKPMSIPSVAISGIVSRARNRSTIEAKFIDNTHAGFGDIAGGP